MSSSEPWKKEWNKLYEKVAEEVHKDFYEKIKEEINNFLKTNEIKKKIVIWDIGSNFKIWNIGNQNVRFFSFDKYAPKENAKEDGNKKLINVDCDIFENKNFTNFIKKIKDEQIPCPDAIIAKHFFSRLKYKENYKLLETFKRYWYMLKPGGIFIILDVDLRDENEKEKIFKKIEDAIVKWKSENKYGEEELLEIEEMWKCGIENGLFFNIFSVLPDNLNISSKKIYKNGYNKLIVVEKPECVKFNGDTFKDRMEIVQGDFRELLKFPIWEKIIELKNRKNNQKIKILDIGVGNGRSTKPVLEILQSIKNVFNSIEVEYHLNDVNDKLLDFKENNNEITLEKKIGDIKTLNLTDKYDVIFYSFMYHIIYDSKELVKNKLTNCLNDNGYLIVILRYDQLSIQRGGIFIYNNNDNPFLKAYWGKRYKILQSYLNETCEPFLENRTLKYLYTNNFYTLIINELSNVNKLKLEQIIFYDTLISQEISFEQISQDFWSYFSVGILKDEKEKIKGDLKHSGFNEYRKDIKTKSYLIVMVFKKCYKTIQEG